MQQDLFYITVNEDNLSPNDSIKHIYTANQRLGNLIEVVKICPAYQLEIVNQVRRAHGLIQMKNYCVPSQLSQWLKCWPKD